jgi:hypothetical protein
MPSCEHGGGTWCPHQVGEPWSGREQFGNPTRYARKPRADVCQHALRAPWAMRTYNELCAAPALDFGRDRPNSGGDQCSPAATPTGGLETAQSASPLRRILVGQRFPSPVRRAVAIALCRMTLILASELPTTARQTACHAAQRFGSRPKVQPVRERSRGVLPIRSPTELWDGRRYRSCLIPTEPFRDANTHRSRARDDWFLLRNDRTGQVDLPALRRSAPARAPPPSSAVQWSPRGSVLDCSFQLCDRHRRTEPSHDA